KMSKLEKMRLLLHWVLGLWRHIHRSLTDVVVMHDVYNLGVFTRVICAIRGVPYFVICYGEELSQALIVNSVRSWLRKHIYQWVLNGAKGIISIAAPTTKLLQRFGVPNNRVTEIYPPTPVPEQEPSPEVVESFRHKYNLLGK